MRKTLGVVLALVVIGAGLACQKDSGGLFGSDKAEKQVNFIIHQDRWGEIAPCG